MSLTFIQDGAGELELAPSEEGHNSINLGIPKDNNSVLGSVVVNFIFFEWRQQLVEIARKYTVSYNAWYHRVGFYIPSADAGGILSHANGRFTTESSLLLLLRLIVNWPYTCRCQYLGAGQCMEET